MKPNQHKKRLKLLRLEFGRWTVPTRVSIIRSKQIIETENAFQVDRWRREREKLCETDARAFPLPIKRSIKQNSDATTFDLFILTRKNEKLCSTHLLVV